MAKRVTGPEIEKLIQLLAKVPGLGPRSARRAALHLIKKKEQLLGPLGHAMGEAYDKVKICSCCGNVDTIDPCTVCADDRRDQSVIIVVEDVSDLWALERTGAMNTAYHVLGGHAVAARRGRARGPEHQGPDRPCERRRHSRAHHRRQCDGGRAGNRPLHHRPPLRSRHQDHPACAWRAGGR